MTDETVKRVRGPGRPVLENLRNAGPLLREGEITRTHRVRASAAVHEWFGAMSAEERGAVLARSMVWEDRRVPAVIATYTGAVIERPAAAPTESGMREDTHDAVAGPSQPAERVKPMKAEALDESVTVLRVMSSAIPSSLRNDLRWSPQSYQKLEATLSRESVLKLETIRGKVAWRTSTGESIRKDTVSRLFQAGLLAPA